MNITNYKQAYRDAKRAYLTLKYNYHLLSGGDKTRLLVVVGPSGAGKGTLIEKLRSHAGELFATSVSHTNRKPRPGEIDGVHYHFVTDEVFDKMVKNDQFLEYVYTKDGRKYGTSFEALQKAGDNKIVILEIDVKGAKVVSDRPEFDALFIFIMPPSLEVLESRLRSRGTESEPQIRHRMQIAEKQIAEGRSYPNIIINRNLEKSFTLFKDMISKHFTLIL